MHPFTHPLTYPLTLSIHLSSLSLTLLPFPTISINPLFLIPSYPHSHPCTLRITGTTCWTKCSGWPLIFGKNDGGKQHTAQVTTPLEPLPLLIYPLVYPLITHCVSLHNTSCISPYIPPVCAREKMESSTLLRLPTPLITFLYISS